MSVTYAQLSSGGPAYATFNSQTIQFQDDTSVETALVTDVIESSLYGAVDEIRKDLIVKAAGKPRFYDTATLSTMFPWIAAPVGTLAPGNSALPAEWFA